MGFTLDVSSCVVVGRFNPAILLPEWIVKEGILPDSEFEAISPFGSSTPVFGMQGLEWRAALNRFEVIASKEGADAGDFVAQVLSRLTHTPTKAVGSNFRFGITSGAEGLYSLAAFPLLGRIASETHSLVGGTASASVTHEDSVMRVELGFELPPRVNLITFNFNRESLTAADAVAAARQWTKDKVEALRIVRDLMGE